MITARSRLVGIRKKKRKATAKDQKANFRFCFFGSSQTIDKLLLLYCRFGNVNFLVLLTPWVTCSLAKPGCQVHSLVRRYFLMSSKEASTTYWALIIPNGSALSSSLISATRTSILSPFISR